MFPRANPALLRAAARTTGQLRRRPPAAGGCRRSLSFTFPTPKTLPEILKVPVDDLPRDPTELSALWTEYHAARDDLVGLDVDAAVGERVLARAKDCPFFVSPVFRDGGYFNLLLQCQPPHFILAYLEDYQKDPGNCSPLLTFSIFDDLADSSGRMLVRGDVVGAGDILTKAEAAATIRNVVEMYGGEEYEAVRTFNKDPPSFDFEKYVAGRESRWKGDDGKTV